MLRTLTTLKLEEAEVSALLGPIKRDVPGHQIGEREFGRLSAIDNGTRNVGSEIGQPDQAADVWPRTAVVTGEFVQRFAVLEPPSQVTSPGKRSHQRPIHA